MALAKDRKPDSARATRGETRGGSSRSGGTNGSRSAGTGTARKGGRTRPPTQVVTAQRKPWGLIAAAIAVVVFAAAVITYATVQVNRANEDRVTSITQIDGVQATEYAAGQQHVTTPVDYTESPPVGGPHDGVWADCTGTVYDVDVRHENAVHSLEHGAVWITYNPDLVGQEDIDRLAELVDGEAGRMLSPYAGLDSAVSLQSWNHQLKVDSAGDERIEQFADLMTFNATPYGDDDERNELAYPEIGASCENPQFAASPLVAGEESAPVGSSDMATTPTAGSTGTP
ncbi:DUF3105 domain-containing protein [Geodermatophilus sp. SYSU D00815]